MSARSRSFGWVAANGVDSVGVSWPLLAAPGDRAVRARDRAGPRRRQAALPADRGPGRARRAEEAIALYTRHLADSPTQVREHRFMARAYLAARDYVEAGRVIAAGLALDPDERLPAGAAGTTRGGGGGMAGHHRLVRLARRPTDGPVAQAGTRATARKALRRLSMEHGRCRCSRAASRPLPAVVVVAGPAPSW